MARPSGLSVAVLPAGRIDYLHLAVRLMMADLSVTT